MSGNGDNIATIRINQADYTITRVVDVSINSVEMIADAVVRKMKDERKKGKKGKWLTSDDSWESGICSRCGYDTQEPVSYAVTNFQYCPNCGFPMER